MQTSCPECRTSFRVSQAQLGLRRGLVRCGKCNAVFNAYDTLLPELEEPPMPPREPVLDALSDSATLPELSLPGWIAETPPPQPEIVQASTVIVVDEVDDEKVPLISGETSESILLSELPKRKPLQSTLPVWKRLLYGLSIFALILLFVLQSAYILRAEVAAALPASRPLLELLCQPLGCDVPLPRQLDRQAIVASNLEHDTEQKSRVRLTFLLANRTGQIQAWPTVSLTLTDVRETPVAQKLFSPEIYLPKGTNVQSGMANGSEREIRLELDIGNLAATGFTLSLVYP